MVHQACRGRSGGKFITLNGMAECICFNRWRNAENSLTMDSSYDGEGRIFAERCCFIWWWRVSISWETTLHWAMKDIRWFLVIDDTVAIKDRRCFLRIYATLGDERLKMVPRDRCYIGRRKKKNTWWFLGIYVTLDYERQKMVSRNPCYIGWWKAEDKALCPFWRWET